MKPIQIYGTKTCSDCIRTKYWLKEHAIPFTELFLEDDDTYVDEILKITNGDIRTPVLIFPDGSTLVEPTNEELAKKITLA